MPRAAGTRSSFHADGKTVALAKCQDRAEDVPTFSAAGTTGTVQASGMPLMELEALKAAAREATARWFRETCGVVPDQDSEEWGVGYRRQFALAKARKPGAGRLKDLPAGELRACLACARTSAKDWIGTRELSAPAFLLVIESGSSGPCASFTHIATYDLG
jgi:hypothetical protein